MDESDDDVNPWDIGLPEAKTATEQLIQDRGSLDRMALYLKLSNERHLESTQSEEASDTGFE